MVHINNLKMLLNKFEKGKMFKNVLDYERNL